MLGREEEVGLRYYLSPLLDLLENFEKDSDHLIEKDDEFKALSTPLLPAADEKKNSSYYLYPPSP